MRSSVCLCAPIHVSTNKWLTEGCWLLLIHIIVSLIQRLQRGHTLTLLSPSLQPLWPKQYSLLGFYCRNDWRIITIIFTQIIQLFKILWRQRNWSHRMLFGFRITLHLDISGKWRGHFKNQCSNKTYVMFEAADLCFNNPNSRQQFNYIQHVNKCQNIFVTLFNSLGLDI